MERVFLEVADFGRLGVRRVVPTIVGLALVGALSGCGVDGSPFPPDDREQPEPGISLSGAAEIGVVGGSGQSTKAVSSIDF